MHCNTRQLLGIAVAALLSGTASAARVGIDLWTSVSGLDGTGTASVDPGNQPGDPLTLPNGPSLNFIDSMSFSTGNGAAFQVGILESTQTPLTEYVFGGTLGTPTEQVIIDPVLSGGSTTNEFRVQFGYLNASAGETAKLTVNGVTYQTKAGVAPSSLGDGNFGPGIAMSLTNSSAVFDFLGGKLNDAKEIAAGWFSSNDSLPGEGTTGGMSAPEIDPASATSALTLLAGSLAIVLGGGKRRELNRQRAK